MTRNYSFLKSKRLPDEKMTEINGIRIPSVPGSSYHAIICALAEHKDRVVPWQKLFQSVEKYMRQYGGIAVWEKFFKKTEVKSCQKRIRDNVHALTRSGKNCYGYRLHERGMAIYFFQDGVMLVTGGTLTKHGSKYDVVFSDGKHLQKRYKGKIITSQEYSRFVDLGYITPSCEILNNAKVLEYRRASEKSKQMEPFINLKESKPTRTSLEVCVTLSDDYDQNTAFRLEALGLAVDQAMGDQLIGHIPEENLVLLNGDDDVLDVEIIE